MKIAICDDDSLEIAHISSLLNTYRLNKSIDLKYKVYKNATDLLAELNNQYDLLLLDIIMPGFSGIQAAKEIRMFDKDVKIIFLTSSPDFAVDSYSVRANDYILKPIQSSKFFAALDNILFDSQPSFDGISVRTKTSIIRILYSKLEFVEVMNKHLYFHMSDGSVNEIYATLSEYESQLLEQPGFIKVHRSYIVNLCYMNELTSNSFITNNNKSVSISRLLFASVRQSYMEHLFIDTRIK